MAQDSKWFCSDEHNKHCINAKKLLFFRTSTDIKWNSKKWEGNKMITENPREREKGKEKRKRDSIKKYYKKKVSLLHFGSPIPYLLRALVCESASSVVSCVCKCVSLSLWLCVHRDNTDPGKILNSDKFLEKVTSWNTDKMLFMRISIRKHKTTNHSDGNCNCDSAHSFIKIRRDTLRENRIGKTALRCRQATF